MWIIINKAKPCTILDIIKSMNIYLNFLFCLFVCVLFVFCVRLLLAASMRVGYAIYGAILSLGDGLSAMPGIDRFGNIYSCYAICTNW